MICNVTGSLVQVGTVDEVTLAQSTAKASAENSTAPTGILVTVMVAVPPGVALKVRVTVRLPSAVMRMQRTSVGTVVIAKVALLTSPSAYPSPSGYPWLSAYPSASHPMVAAVASNAVKAMLRIEFGLECLACILGSPFRRPSVAVPPPRDIGQTWPMLRAVSTSCAAGCMTVTVAQSSLRAHARFEDPSKCQRRSVWHLLPARRDEVSGTLAPRHLRPRSVWHPAAGRHPGPVAPGPYELREVSQPPAPGVPGTCDAATRSTCDAHLRRGTCDAGRPKCLAPATRTCDASAPATQAKGLTGGALGGAGVSVAAVAFWASPAAGERGCPGLRADGQSPAADCLDPDPC